MMELFKFENECWIERSRLPDSLEIDFEKLWSLHPEEYGHVIMQGKTISTPRWQQNYMKTYRFAGLAHESVPLPPLLQPLLDWVNDQNIYSFNQVLVNWYQNGHHYIGAHSDNTWQLEHGSPIVSISLGADRVFRIRDKQNKTIIKNINLTDRTCVIMGGRMQEYYTHEIPKITGNKGANIGRRINITFRVFK